MVLDESERNFSVLPSQLFREGIEEGSPGGAAIRKEVADLIEKSKRDEFYALGIVLGFRCCSRSEEHTSELQSLMRISYAVFCLKKKTLAHGSTPPRPDNRTEQQQSKHPTLVHYSYTILYQNKQTQEQQ